MATVGLQATLSAEDVAQIRGITDEWVRVSLVRDWEGLTALLTDDVVFLPPDAPVVVGKPAVRDFLEAFPAITSFTATVIAAEGQPELAWARGSFTMTIEPTPGQGVPMVGKWGATYRKRADGTWHCASDTWNLDAPLSL
jgi:ketosteroid isomerase-like protein